jgi:hypothetical protein
VTRISFIRRSRLRHVRLLSALVLALSCLSLTSINAASAGAATGTGHVFLVHGLIGETLDIVVDGTVVAPRVAPKSVVGPLTLAAGTHRVELRSGSTVRARATVTLKSGATVDVVAHRDGDTAGTPTITVFSDDLSPVGPGKFRLAVAHTAAAPPADIRVDGKVLFSNVASGEALTLVVPAVTYSVDIVPTAADSPVILGPLSLKPKSGTLTRVFAVGDVKSGSMDAVVHQLAVPVSGAGLPGSVPTGDGGQLARSGRPFGPAAALLGLAALGCAALALSGGPVRRRSTR